MSTPKPPKPGPVKPKTGSASKPTTGSASKPKPGSVTKPKTEDPPAKSGGTSGGNDAKPGEVQDGWFKGKARATGTAAMGYGKDWAGKAAGAFKDNTAEAVGTWGANKVKGALGIDDASQGGDNGSKGGGSEGEGGGATGAGPSVGEGEGASPSTGIDSVPSGAGPAYAGGAGGAVGTGARSYITERPYGGSMPPGMASGSDAYGWTQAQPPAPMQPIEPATHPSRSGLSGWLDDKVEGALKESGLLDWLEKVTGNLDELNSAADEWQAQAKAVQTVAEQLRAECRSLPEQWQGQASDAFGRHMGEVVESLDSTADGLYQTAQIINQAAQMCAMAENMVIEIISEAIESLIASLAVEAVVAVLTLGIGAIAGAMLDAVEISAFIARVAKVSEELATNLEKLVKALKEMRSALKAVKSLKDARNALKAVREVKGAVKGLRDMEKGGDSLGKIYKDAKEAKSLEGVAGKVGDYAVRKAAGYADQKATDWVQGEIKSEVFGDDKGDSVDYSGRVTTGQGWKGDLAGTAKSFGGAMWSSAKGVVGDEEKGAFKSALEGEAGYQLQSSETGRQILDGEASLGDHGFIGQKLQEHLEGNEKVKGVLDAAQPDPAPYRVDKSRIENAFG